MGEGGIFPSLRKNAFFIVEIADTVVKLAYAQRVQDKLEIKGVSAEKASINKEGETIVKFINDFVHTYKIKKKTEVVNVIPSIHLISKHIEIPSIDPKEIKDIIDLQAGRHTPYSREEIILEYSEIGVLHGRYTKILLVIVKKEIVSQREELLKQAGFVPEHVVFASESIARSYCAFSKDHDPVPVGIIHFDVNHTDFIMVQSGKCLYSRSIPFEQTEGLPAAKDDKAQLIEELKRSLEGYQAENIDVLPNRFFLSGAQLKVQAFSEEITKAFGIKSLMFDYGSFLNLSTRVKDQLAHYQDISFFPVMGTPYIIDELSIDLIPEDIKVKRELKLRAKKYTFMGILAMAIFILFCVGLVTLLSFKKLYYKKLLISYTDENDEAQRLKDISERTRIAKKFVQKKEQTLFMLTNLFKAIPKTVYLSSIKFSEDQTITITGTAEAMSQVFSMVTELESHEFFGQVKVDFTKSRRFKNKEVADFGLTFILDKEF